MKEKLIRLLLPLAVIVVLNMAGIINLSLLPFENPDFQATLATVAVYLIWSVLESNVQTDTSRITLYAVLLVSVLDSFLIRLTAFTDPMFIRWLGVAVLTAGCGARLAGLSRDNDLLARRGRAAQMAGLALGLGSIAGTVIAIFPGIPSALRKKD